MINEAGAEVVACRLCNASVARSTEVCPSCGVKTPWVSDEPSISPRVIRLAMWVGSVVIGVMLLFVAGMLAFGPVAEDDERDHRPPGTRAAHGR